MGINVIIHKTHRIFTNGAASVLVEGKTTGECLQALVMRFPEMKRVLFNAQDELLNTIEVCVNHESTYPDQLTTSVSDGDEIELILFFAGG